jgi:hypothetical protein
MLFRKTQIKTIKFAIFYYKTPYSHYIITLHQKYQTIITFYLFHHFHYEYLAVFQILSTFANDLELTLKTNS